MTAQDIGGPERSDFIRDIVEEDLRLGRNGGRVVTRFPPEPNGYLHIGHAKSICLNFGLAEQFRGRCNLRFDDTNPLAEDVEYVQSIEQDINWLGFSFGDHARFASDYFAEMYELAEDLVAKGKAYVDDLSDEEIKDYRGTLGEPGRPSPCRSRSVEENLALFRQMRAGAFPDGARVLRARIDLASPNMKMRDPLLYRIRHAHHHRTGDRWPIYPMYDWAHPISDAIEGVTHSLCTLEFENNRELYDWVVDNTGVSEKHGFSRPHQYEFARLNLDYTVMSKRKLLALVEGGSVSGWDDPRLPTIAGMRRRGYRPEAIRAFATLVGVAKVNSVVDMEKLEFCVRDDLNWIAPRVLGVLRPLKVTITSWPETEVAELVGPYFPPDVAKPGERVIPFEREIFIEADDFRLDPPAGYQRLAPGRTVRLRYGPCITCDEVISEGGEVVEVRAHHFPDSIGRNPPGVKVAGVIHWVPATRSLPAEVRLYDRLLRVPQPEEGGGDELNPDSLVVLRGARLEPSLADAAPGSRWQLERVGYFVFDIIDSHPGAPVLNRIVALRDSWQGRSQPAQGAVGAVSGVASSPAAEGDAPAGGQAVEAAGGPSGEPGSGPSAEPGSGPSGEPSHGPSGEPGSGPSGEPGRGPSAESERAPTRPAKRSRIEYRAEARVRDPELAERLASWPARYRLAEGDVDLLTGDRATGDLFEAAVAAGATPAAVARWVINEVPREVGDRDLGDTALTGAALGTLVQVAESGQITGAAAKEVFSELVARGGDPRDIIAERGLAQISDEDTVARLVDEVLAANQDKVEQYRGGKTGLLGFFVGQVVRASRGKADPKVVHKLLGDRLGAD